MKELLEYMDRNPGLVAVMGILLTIGFIGTLAFGYNMTALMLDRMLPLP